MRGRDEVLRSCPSIFLPLAIAACAAQVAVAPALAGPFGLGDDPAIVNACAAERAPLLALERQYQEADEPQLGVDAGFGGGGSGGRGGRGSGAGRGPSNQSSPQSRGPHADHAGAGRGGRRTEAASAAAHGSTTSYLALKRQIVNADRRLLALSIDDDAAGLLVIAEVTQTQTQALAACRVRQVADYRARLAAAGDEADRARLKREGDQISQAIRHDIALSEAVVGRQANLAKVFTQARAMAEGLSEADVLAGESPAYQAAASTKPLEMSDASKTSGGPAHSPAPLVLATLGGTVVREAPSATARVVLTLPAQRELRPGEAAKDGWYEIDLGGAPGFIPAASVSQSPRAPAVPTTAAALAPARNIQAYNKVVLEARDEGPDRLKTLLTGFS